MAHSHAYGHTIIEVLFVVEKVCAASWLNHPTQGFPVGDPKQVLLAESRQPILREVPYLSVESGQMVAFGDTRPLRRGGT